MSTDQNTHDAPEQGFDLFELATAMLLGIAAIGAAIAGFQGGQWGGKQLEAFSEANTMTTKAATEYNEASVLINADYAAVAVAKEHILEGRDAGDGAGRERHFDLANYYYTTQLTENAYKALELPLEFYVEDSAEGQPAAKPAAPAPPPPAEEGEEGEEGADAGAAIEREVPDQELLDSLGTELDEDYVDGMLSSATKQFTDAEKRFNEGKVANENGDNFDLAGVFFTVALFFAGLGLVFKTSMRWIFFALGTLVFVGSTIFMLTLPWAG